MGHIEKRLRRLEETVERGGFDAALSSAPDSVLFTLVDYNNRAHDAEAAGKPAPVPTPEEIQAAKSFEELRKQAVRDGWSEGRFRTF